MNKSSNNQNYNKISRTYRYTILFILACMHISTNVHGVSVSVGAVNFSNAASDSQGAEADVTIDGDRGGLQDGHGWSPTFGADDPAIALPHTIQWNLWITDPVLTTGQSIDFYTYQIDIYYAWAPAVSLGSFSMDANFNPTGETENFQRITTYDSLSTTSGVQTMSANDNGFISCTEPDDANDPQIVHSMVFSVESHITHLRLNTLVRPGWSTNQHFKISEIEGSASAEVVPEPSTYALIAGLASFAWIIARRRKLESV